MGRKKKKRMSGKRRERETIKKNRIEKNKRRTK